MYPLTCPSPRPTPQPNGRPAQHLRGRWMPPPSRIALTTPKNNTNRKSKFYFTFFLSLLTALPHMSSPQLPPPHDTTTTPCSLTRDHNHPVPPHPCPHPPPLTTMTMTTTTIVTQPPPIHATNDLAHRVCAHHTQYRNKKKKSEFFCFFLISFSLYLMNTPDTLQPRPLHEHLPKPDHHSHLLPYPPPPNKNDHPHHTTTTHTQQPGLPPPRPPHPIVKQ
jgi:hypothetical protein